MDNTKTFVVDAPDGPRPPVPPPNPSLMGTIQHGSKDEKERIVVVDGQVREDVTPPAVWLHNWMYSIVPGPEFQIYLAGYCKNCRTAFTRLLPTGYPTETRYVDVSVDKYGCVGPG
jgi:hypothetical protein